MKKLLIILIGCLLVMDASAAGKTKSKVVKSTTPITKGEWFLAPSLTNIGVNAVSFKPKGSSTSENVTRFGLQGTGGYAISNKLAIEGGLGFQFGKMEGSKLSMFDITAGARYYFYKNLYGNADFIFGTGKASEVGEISEDLPGAAKVNAFNLMLGVGYDFMISKKFAFEPSISYAFALAAKANDMPFNLGVFSINLGFVYFF